MTVETDSFPVGYFYIISKMNGMAMDIDKNDGVKAGTRIVTALKEERKPERDSQLWIHQNGFLTNKFSGLVLDVGKSKKFIDIFTGHDHLYVDVMKHEENADDQRFGYSSEHGHIYTLSETDQVVDIRKKEMEAGATIMIYKKAETPEKGINQLWDLQLADPPRVLDSSDDEEDDCKRARLTAWFGNWFGWGHNEKNEVLQEKELQKAHKKVYEKKKSHLSYEIIAGAVAVQAVKMYMEKQEENGEEVRFKGAKEAIAAYAAKEMVKMFTERGTDDDDDDEDEEQKEKKQSLLQKMAQSAALNYFETKYKN
ncbi:hypothetical protein BDF20DRAFT_873838 [Mycotypha africana]|uniref:uncharacterized protein n=1 Tax=Mycotypha africana TaxID=64632 RepID=UPI00230007CB|nr:uncharacterized protein BDF20DRAFT_873838 [Mycotypha africana]KAI8977259.1 hypothetical protein BDF20DRAFT_873838 [Mycotypha africana]